MTVDDPQEANDSRVVERTRPVELPGGAAPLAAWLFVFLVVRLFAISGYNWDTAFLVSTTLGLDDGLRILFGSFMTGRLVVAPLLVVMLPLLVAAFLWSPSGRRPTVVLLAGLAISALLSLTMSFRAWWLLPITAAVFGALVLVRQLRLDSFPRRALTAAIDDARRADKAGGLLLLVGVVNIPIIYFSVKWWNTLHQGSSVNLTKSSMAETMLWGMLLMAMCFWMYAVAVACLRARTRPMPATKAALAMSPCELSKLRILVVRLMR